MAPPGSLHSRRIQFVKSVMVSSVLLCPFCYYNSMYSKVFAVVNYRVLSFLLQVMGVRKVPWRSAQPAKEEEYRSRCSKLGRA